MKADAVGHAGDGITAGFVGPFRFLDEGGAGFVEAVGRGVLEVVVFERILPILMLQWLSTFVIDRCDFSRFSLK